MKKFLCVLIALVLAMSLYVFLRPDDTSLNILYVKESFVFPNIFENEIDEIWMYLSADNANKITDEKMVEKIVGLAKNDDDFGADEDIYSYISEKSCDGYHIFMKYKGYPLIEEFVLTEKEIYTQRQLDALYQEISLKGTTSGT